MKTIGQIGKLYGLSRSTLLYYDSIRLLSPSSVGENGYRLFSPEDERRLSSIVALKNVGLPLKEVKRILDASSGRQAELTLMKKLLAINDEIESLKNTQKLIVEMLKGSGSRREQVLQNLKTLIRRFRAKHSDIKKLHAQFKTQSPEVFRTVLNELGFTEEEADRILDE